MGENTTISWATHTFNAWWGCTKVGNSPACDNCYAETWAKRTGFQIWGDDASRRYFSDKHWNEPLKWNKAAELAGGTRASILYVDGRLGRGTPRADSTP